MVTKEQGPTTVGIVKEKREQKLKTNSPEKFIEGYYRDYHALGISEEELLALALESKPGG